MKKCLTVVIAGGLVVCSTMAQESLPATQRMSKEEYQARAEKLMMKRYGGIVRKANSGMGVVLFVNAQSKVSTAEIRMIEKRFSENLCISCITKEFSSINLANPTADIKALGGNLGVVVVDKAELPALLTAPEEGWAIVNVAALSADVPDGEKLASRTRKEILRGFALVAGGAFMTRDPIVMRKDVRIAKDLDLIPAESYGLDVINAMKSVYPYFGVKPWKQTTYRKACEEGWAPAPTNDAQKAIWDKVHAPPEKPLKITYDKDKQKPVVK